MASEDAAPRWQLLSEAVFDDLVAQILVEPQAARDAPLVRRKDDGSTLLHVVAGWKHSEQIVRDLLEAGVPPDVRDDTGWTPLLEASQEGQFEVCQALLEAGATPDLPCGEVTPIHAAVEVGNEEMVRWLLRQPGTWPRRYDGQFFAFLLDKAPGAVTDYLDVFATVLNHSHKGYEAVKYTDLRIIYGEPDIPVSQTALALVAESSAAHTILSHRLMRLILHAKWHSFARAMFRRELAAYTMLVVSYFIPTVWGSPDWIRLKSHTGKMVAALRFISWLLSIFLLLHVERNECRGEGVRRYFASFWNWIGVITYSAIICSIPLEFVAYSELTQQVRNSVLALIIVCLWVNLLQFLQMSRDSGLIIAMMAHMVKDIYRFFLLYSVFLLGFSGAFYLLLGETSGYETFTTSFITVYLMLYGQLTYDNFKNAKGCVWYTSNFLLLVHLLSAVVVLLNILIAMMATTYAEVWDAAEAEALRSYAQAIVRLEKALTPKQRRDKFLQLLAVSKPKANTRSTREGHYAVNKAEEEGDTSLSARATRRQNVILNVAEKMRRVSIVSKPQTQPSKPQQSRVIPVAEIIKESEQPRQESPPKLKRITREASRIAIHELARDVVALNLAMKKPVLSTLEDGVRYEVPKKGSRGQTSKDEVVQLQIVQAQQTRQQRQQLAELQTQVEQLTAAMTNLQASMLTHRIRGPPIPKY
ncbi:Transient receptor potential channel pyrexia [Phytophthora citrophthora]|uniref:Transient receptor potential channel pyrexia n=1 Tax=Phytophthora citrophthora TaxID=4793 RepID=A0AAD9GH84_9STRA|nr:Transient receptor potential channel pyrexia [Phytophthora citrophthora]